jgi:hypothetical protein
MSIAQWFVCLSPSPSWCCERFSEIKKKKSTLKRDRQTTSTKRPNVRARADGFLGRLDVAGGARAWIGRCRASTTHQRHDLVPSATNAQQRMTQYLVLRRLLFFDSDGVFAGLAGFGSSASSSSSSSSSSLLLLLVLLSSFARFSFTTKRSVRFESVSAGDGERTDDAPSAVGSAFLSSFCESLALASALLRFASLAALSSVSFSAPPSCEPRFSSLTIHTSPNDQHMRTHENAKSSRSVRAFRVIRQFVEFLAT